METRIVRRLKKAYALSALDTASAQWVRFGVVYALLFLLMLCTSSGVFGQTSSTRLSLEKFEMKPIQADTPLFGDYYLDQTKFKGNFNDQAPDIQALVEARKAFIEKVRLQEHTEKTKLKEAHRALMNSTGTTSDGVKWSQDLYTNITQQALLKQESESKIAAWDSKNYMNVKTVTKNGKKYVTALQVMREKGKAHKAIASAP